MESSKGAFMSEPEKKMLLAYLRDSYNVIHALESTCNHDEWDWKELSKLVHALEDVLNHYEKVSSYE